MARRQPRMSAVLAVSLLLTLKPRVLRTWGVAILLAAMLPPGQPSERERRQEQTTTGVATSALPSPTTVTRSLLPTTPALPSPTTVTRLLSPTSLTTPALPSPTTVTKPLSPTSVAAQPTLTPPGDPCDVIPDPGVSDQCSLGSVTCPDSETLSRQASGLFFLSPNVSCDVGVVVSWHTCAYFTVVESGAVFRLIAGVYRRINDSYTLISPPERIDVDRLSENSSFGCESRDEEITLMVEREDMIGVAVISGCRGMSTRVCPPQPFLDTAPNVSLPYLPGANGLPDTVQLSDLQTIQIGLNFMVSIASPLPTDNPTTSPSSISTQVVIIVIVVIALVLFGLIIASLLICLFIRNTRSKKHQFHSLNTVDGSAEPQQKFEGDYFLLQKEERSHSGGTYARNRAFSEPNQYSAARNVSRRHREESFILQSHRNSVIKTDADPSYHYSMPYVEGDAYWAPAGLEEELREQLRRLEIPDIPSDELTIGEYLGSGQFGMVNRGVWHTSEEVAVKSLPDDSSEDERVKFLQEAAIMGQFKHPNIIRLIGVHLDEPVRIVCELMQKGDLIHHLILVRPDDGESVPPELPAILLSFCRQIAAGMSYLSHKGFIHRDLAARNILLSQDCVCKIADFGLSRALQDEEFYTSHGGKIPVKWTAPEALNYRQYSTASDVWSYGVLLYEIWSLGKKPYGECTNSEVLRKVSSGLRQAPPAGCPKSLYELMMQCWHPQPESRPKFAEILLSLQKPDFKLLQLSSDDTSPPAARTLGSPVESASELYKELQDIYVNTS